MNSPPSKKYILHNDNLKRGIYGNLIAATVMLLILVKYMPLIPIGLWIGVHFIVAFGRLYALKRLNDASLGAALEKRLLWVYDAFSLISGSLWGVLALCAKHWGTWDFQLIAIIIVFGLTSASVVSLSPMRRAFLFFITLAIAPHIVTFFFTDHLFSSTLAVLILIYFFLILQNGISYAKRLTEYQTQSEDLKRARNIAEREKSTAQKANLAKSDFLASMSHELRTPLNAILGFSQLIDLDSELSNENRENIQEIDTAGRLLLTLIDDLLDLSRIESGQTSLDIEEIKLQDLLHEWRSLTAPLADKYSVKINLKLAEAQSNIRISTDPTRLTQIILNFVSNAAKYNRPGGAVTLKISLLPSNRIRFSISDTGPGISSENQQKLFQPFERLGAQNSNIQGTGIGLIIAKKLATAMGGSIGFESEEGNGSTFWLELECPYCIMDGEHPATAPDKAQDSTLKNTLPNDGVI